PAQRETHVNRTDRAESDPANPNSPGMLFVMEATDRDDEGSDNHTDEDPEPKRQEIFPMLSKNLQHLINAGRSPRPRDRAPAGRRCSIRFPRDRSAAYGSRRASAPGSSVFRRANAAARAVHSWESTRALALSSSSDSSGSPGGRSTSSAGAMRSRPGLP